jgi:hypothetical protein
MLDKFCTTELAQSQGRYFNLGCMKQLRGMSRNHLKLSSWCCEYCVAFSCRDSFGWLSLRFSNPDLKKDKSNFIQERNVPVRRRRLK